MTQDVYKQAEEDRLSHRLVMLQFDRCTEGPPWRTFEEFQFLIQMMRKIEGWEDASMADIVIDALKARVVGHSLGNALASLAEVTPKLVDKDTTIQ